MIRPATLHALANLRALPHARGGVAALEFALCAPILCLIFAGTADLGMVLYTKFKLDAAASAATNYAVINASSVNSTNGATLASNLASIVETSEGTSFANGTVVVNNGPSDTISGGTISAGGTASNADSCYCPTGSPTSVTWGSAVSCGSSCAGGGYAGKFVVVTASRTYTPIFSSYGIVKNGTISVGAAAQVQ